MVFEDYKEVQRSSIRVSGEFVELTLEVRKDPLFGLHSASISPERAKRGGAFTQNTQEHKMTPKEQCRFCKEGGLYEKTPDERIFHARTNPNQGYELVTVVNRFPFSIPHLVTVISNNHDPDLLKLGKEEIMNYVESGYELMQRIKQVEGVTGAYDFINWGKRAGGTLDHPHAQRGGLTALMETLPDREMKACQTRRKETRTDIVGDYLDKIVKDGSLFCFENEDFVVVVPYAPMYSDGVDIYYKRNANNLLDLRPGERVNAAEAITKAIHSLASLDTLPEGERRAKVTDLNVVLHQARFDDPRDYYRLHWHIFPRMTQPSSVETGYDLRVLEVYPETTAKDIRALHTKF